MRKTTIRNLIYYHITLILLIISLVLVGCSATDEPKEPGTESNTEQTGLMSGFQIGNGDESPSITCAYKADKNEFDIDDVTLTFYYGSLFSPSIEHELAHGANYPTFDLYFEGENNKKHIIKNVTENFVSEKYRSEWVHDENRNVIDIVYNYSEKITIPQDFFVNDHGWVRFAIYSENVNHIEPCYRWLTGITIYYNKIATDRVQLFSQPILD